MTGRLRITTTDLGGDGALLLVGPSLGTTAAGLWSAAADVLRRSFHVVGWDLPGHGSSPVADEFDVRDLAEGVLAAVGEPFVYAGVSLGGAVGLQLLLAAPSRVERAVLISTGASIGAPAAWYERAAQVRRDGTRSLVEGARERWFAPPNRDSAAAAELLRGLVDVDADSYAAACEALARYDVRARLAEIDRPVVAIAGGLDPVTTPATLRHIATGVQFGSLAIVPDVSHQLIVEAPQQAASLVVLEPAHHAAPVLTLPQLRARGMRVRREVLGDDYVDRTAETTGTLASDFQDLITRYAWGDVWSRPGLDRRTRSMLTVALLATLGHDRELALHLRAAIRNGVTADEVAEVLLHVAVYAGVPAANTAFGTARQALDEVDGGQER